MALGGVGYFADNYFATQYWAEDYWTETAGSGSADAKVMMILGGQGVWFI